MANVAVGIGWNDGVAKDVRLALGCVGSKPFRVAAVEESLHGKTAGEIAEGSAKVAEEAARLCDPLEDLWGSVEYKRQVVKALVMDGLSRVSREKTNDG
jgi:xanthine dehydrogenase YagS FAD-binding subunit